MNQNRRRKGRRLVELGDTAFASCRTQAHLARLLRLSKADLMRLINYKAQFISSRVVPSKRKVRCVDVPEDRLRRAHEILASHLSGVRLPNYYMSPAPGRSQRDNAEAHLPAKEIFRADIRKFYPSTTREMVKRWGAERAKLPHDVAAKLADLTTYHNVVMTGSPLSPILCALVHEKMFSEIDELCKLHGLVFTLWVDNIVISGGRLPSGLREKVRAIVRRYGLSLHEMNSSGRNDTTVITGIGVSRGRMFHSPKRHLRIRKLCRKWIANRGLESDISSRVLSEIGAAVHTLSAPFGAKKSSRSRARLKWLRNQIRVERSLAIKPGLLPGRSSAMTAEEAIAALG